MNVYYTGTINISLIIENEGVYTRNCKYELNYYFKLVATPKDIYIYI
jgi:hypothetical protein